MRDLKKTEKIASHIVMCYNVKIKKHTDDIIVFEGDGYEFLICFGEYCRINNKVEVTNIEEFTEQDMFSNVTRGVYVTLDRPVNTGNINIQYFAIRRNTVNPNFIMIDS